MICPPLGHNNTQPAPISRQEEIFHRLPLAEVHTPAFIGLYCGSLIISYHRLKINQDRKWGGGGGGNASVVKVEPTLHCRHIRMMETEGKAKVVTSV